MAFVLYLCQHLGYASPSRMMDELEPGELELWLAYFETEPFGEVRSDLRHGISLANLMMPHVRKGKKLKPQDFIPRFTAAQKPVQTPEQQLRIIEQLVYQMGWEDARPKEKVH